MFNNSMSDLREVHEHMRRKIWIEVYLESIRQSGRFSGASADANRALVDFDEKFKLDETKPKGSYGNL